MREGKVDERARISLCRSRPNVYHCECVLPSMQLTQFREDETCAGGDDKHRTNCSQCVWIKDIDVNIDKEEVLLVMMMMMMMKIVNRMGW